MESLGQDIRFPGRDLNPGPPEYGAGGIPWCLEGDVVSRIHCQLAHFSSCEPSSLVAIQERDRTQVKPILK
jgi:hypothetical protein